MSFCLHGESVDLHTYVHIVGIAYIIKMRYANGRYITTDQITTGSLMSRRGGAASYKWAVESCRKGQGSKL